MKRRRAVRERNSPRNSRLETQRDDGWGRQPSWPPSVVRRKTTADDRFPDALKNSYRKLPRSGILLMSFEAGRRHVAECGMQAPWVVDLFPELADRRASLGQVPVLVA